VTASSFTVMFTVLKYLFQMNSFIASRVTVTERGRRFRAPCRPALNRGCSLTRRKFTSECLESSSPVGWPPSGGRAPGGAGRSPYMSAAVLRDGPRGSWCDAKERVPIGKNCGLRGSASRMSRRQRTPQPGLRRRATHQEQLCSRFP